MCGRYTHLYTWQQLHHLLDLVHWPDVELTPRFNVAPTQSAPVVRTNPQGMRSGSLLRWGLVPSWASDLASGSRLTNARGETVFDKPAFRKAAMERRCLVPISGFYEWQTVPGEALKRPHWIGRADHAPLCLAGLWESWNGQGQSPAVETFTILTTTPSSLIRPLHDRMPVILAKPEQDAWLDPTSSRLTLAQCVRPADDADLVIIPVGREVNSPANDHPGLMAAAPAPKKSPSLFE